MSDLVKIILDADDKASDKIDGLSKSLGGLGSVAGGAMKLGLAAGAAAAAGMTAALGFMISQAMDSELATAQLDATLRSTAKAASDYAATSEVMRAELGLLRPAAQLSRDELLNYAGAMQQVTRYDDEAILGAESLMLTFTQVGKEVFPSAIEIAMDLSTAMGTDLKGSIVQVGKALQDPAGVTALKKMGVSFSAMQIEAMKALFATGDVAGYHTLVLKELQAEFGGSAKAAGKTFAGQLDILKNSLGDVAEEGGLMLLPMLKDLTSGLLSLVQSPGFKGITQDLAAGVLKGAEAVKALATGFAAGGLKGAVAALGPQVIKPTKSARGADEGTGGMLAAGILSSDQAALLTSAVDMVTTALDQIGAWWTTNGPVITAIATALFDGIISAAQQLWPILLAVAGHVQKLGAAVGGILMQAFTLFGSWWSANGAAITATVQSLFSQLAGGAMTIVNTVYPLLMGVLGQISTWFTANEPLIRALLDTLAQGFMYVVENILPVVIGAIVGLYEAVMPTIQGIVDFVLSMVTMVMQLITGDWAGAWTTAGQAVAGLLGTIMATVKNIFKWLGDQIPGLVKIGGDLIGGLISGISGAVGGLVEAVANGIGAAIAAIKQLLGLASPSKVMMEVGIQTMAGLALGIGAGLAAPRRAMAEAVAGMVGMAGPHVSYNYGGPASMVGAGVAPVQVVYAPTISLATEDEVIDRLLPLLRRAGVAV